MVLYFIIIFSIYYLFLLALNYGWEKANNRLLNTNSPAHPMFISIIIAVRNEEKNIVRLLNCLANQSYPKDQYEVIIIDDHSEDQTVAEVQGFDTSSKLKLKLIKSGHTKQNGVSPKKAALKQGIDTAEGNIILMTDGDCWFGKDWIKSISATFYNKDIKFVAGTVALKEDDTLLSKIQSLEFSSLIGTGGALITLNYPLMCNGANLAFRKEVFYQVNGYSGYEKNSSGDDVFLMQKINNAFKNPILFLKDQSAIVYTFPQPSLSALLHQRKRWASKWQKYPLSFSWAIPVFLFIHYLSFIALIIFSFNSKQVILWTGPLITAKIILDGILLRNVMRLCKLKFNYFTFIISELLYPFYAIIIGFSVHFGTYKWKGRLYKK